MLPAVAEGAAVDPIKCPKCGIEFEYNRTFCPNGHFVGFPNVRYAHEMAADLAQNYNAAIVDAVARSIPSRVQELERLLEGSVATINVQPNIIRNMALGQNYISYYNALGRGARKIAEREYDAHRRAVDDKVHTGYGEEILNAALSLDGRGLTNYGQITLELWDASIEDRASVMRENSFDFYDRYKLGDRNAVEEPGWRSVWSDRARLGIAHLEPAISAATANADFPKIVLFSGATRADDRYMEVHIFGELSWQTLGKVTLALPLTTVEEQDDWFFSRQKLKRCNVDVIDPIYP
jgi:hypothetical protein